MKSFKIFNKIALLLIFTIASNALAQNNIPSEPAEALTIGVADVGAWNDIQRLVNDSLTEENVVINLTSDISFSGGELETIDLNGKNLYLITNDNKTRTLSNIKQAKPLFSNVGDTVVLKNIAFKDIEYSFNNADEKSKGVLFDSLKVSNFFVKNVELDNINVKIDNNLVTDFGFFTGLLKGAFDANSIKVTKFNVETANVTNIGSLIGVVRGDVYLKDVDVDGKMNIDNHKGNSSVDGLSAGSIFGFAYGDMSLINVKSSMELISIINEQAISISHSIQMQYLKNGIGGFVGKSDSSKNLIKIENSEFSGLISSSCNKECPDFGVGGILGLVQHSEMVLLQNIKVENTQSQQLSHEGASVYMGSAIGAIDSVMEFLISNVVTNNNVSITNTQSDDGYSMGGLIGASYQSNITAENDTLSSVLNLKNSKESNFKLVHVGGVMGAFIGEKNNTDSLIIRNIEIVNKITFEQNTSINPIIRAGGLIGEVSQFKKVSISKSKVVPKISNGTQQKLIKFEIDNNSVNQFQVGGMIGFAGSGDSINISTSMVQGESDYSLGEYLSNDAYIAGFIGFIQNSVTQLSEFVYNGGISVEQDNYSNLQKTGVAYFYMTPVSSSPTKILNDGYVLCDDVKSFTENDANIESTKIFLNDSYNVSKVYSMNENKPIWYYDDNLPQLLAFCGNSNDCQVPKKITFKNLMGIGPNADSEVYSSNKGKWNLKASGAVNKMDLPGYYGVQFYANGDSVKVWKDQNDNILYSEAEFADGQVYSEIKNVVPSIKFLTDSTQSVSQSGREPLKHKIELANHANFDITKDAVMPTYVFEDGDSNGIVKYSKNNVWGILNAGYIINDMESLKSYVAKYNAKDPITLVAVVNDNDQSVQPFRKFIRLDNPGATFRYKSLGVDDSLDILGNGRYFPIMTELEFTKSMNGSNCLKFFVDGVLKDTIKMNTILDMTNYIESDIRFFATSCFDASNIPDDSTLQQEPVNMDSINKIVAKIDSANRVNACIENSTISDVEFIKSGKSAAQFNFKFNIADSCDMLNPSASVRGPKGLLWYSPFDSKTNSYSFTNYPLEPGTYKFYIKLTDGKDTTLKKTFNADISIAGHKWSMSAIGSWPKNVLKDGEALIYKWNQENVLGEYWQYEAIPSIKDVVEDVGYWIYAEKNLNFTLDLPLKKANSDTISWKLKKNINGWNLIANPYSWDLGVSSVKNFMDPESNESPFWRYNESSGNFEVASVLGANEAFWISTDKERTVKVSTTPAFVSKMSAPKVLKKASLESWSMLLVASSKNGSLDSWNVLGVGSKDISLEEPPTAMNDFIEVSFVGDGNTKFAKRILAKSSSNEYVWNLNLKASESDKVKLTLNGYENVRSMGYRAILITDGEVLEFGSDASVFVDVSKNSKKALLKVVPANTKVVTVSPISNLRYNVVSHNMVVQFNVPIEMAGQSTSAYLMDINGKIISKVNGKANVGINTFNVKSPVRNGVYVLHVRVGNESKSIRLVI